MTPLTRRWADVLLMAAATVAPASRRDWVWAMQAELAHLSDAAAPSFAWGCLWATVVERTSSESFILQSARWTLVVGAVGWSGANLWLAARLSADNASQPATFACVAAVIFAAGALATAWQGLRTTAILATPALLLAGLVAVGAEMVVPHERHAAFYRALALEDFLVLIVALLTAYIVPHWLTASKETES